MGYSRDERRIAALFTRRGYELHPAVRHSREWGVKRLIYTHPDTNFKIDVFLDELVMAHTIDFAGRLEEREHTVSLADLLLSKLQIYRMTENDLIDLIVLLGEREVGDGLEDIRLARVVSVLSNDWGFYYGAMVNLDKLDEAMERHRDVPPEVAWRVRARSRRLREAIDLAPKTRRWRLRARIGTRATWYEDVAEVEI